MNDADSFLQLIPSRHSLRAFLSQTVLRQTFEDILAMAARMPSR